MIANIFSFHYEAYKVNIMEQVDTIKFYRYGLHGKFNETIWKFDII